MAGIDPNRVSQLAKGHFGGLATDRRKPNEGPLIGSGAPKPDRPFSTRKGRQLDIAERSQNASRRVMMSVAVRPQPQSRVGQPVGLLFHSQLDL